MAPWDAGRSIATVKGFTELPEGRTPEVSGIQKHTRELHQEKRMRDRGDLRERVEELERYVSSLQFSMTALRRKVEQESNRIKLLEKESQKWAK